MNFIKTLFQAKNSRKFYSSSPLIIFESDDWGCIRMPSKEVKERIAKISTDSVNDPYLQFDCLETNEDLEILFNLLSGYKDIQGNHPVITANFVLQNPDFLKIKNSHFQEYFAVDFRDSFADNKNSDRVFSLQKKAFYEGLLCPQFHAMEHIHVERWMQALKGGDALIRLAFENNLISLRNNRTPPCISFFMDAFHPKDEGELKSINQIIENGLIKFRNIWGIPAKSVIAPCYFWHKDSEIIFSENGIEIIQGLRVQKESKLNGDPYSYNKVRHTQGKKNSLGLNYFYRNAFFEPSTDKARDWVGECLSQVKKSINRYGFVIISTHRLNFMGAIEPGNRELNIKLFQSLLDELHRQFPGLQYGTSLDLLKAA